MRPIFLKLKDQNNYQSCHSATGTMIKGTTKYFDWPLPNTGVWPGMQQQLGHLNKNIYISEKNKT